MARYLHESISTRIGATNHIGIVLQEGNISITICHFSDDQGLLLTCAHLSCLPVCVINHTLKISKLMWEWCIHLFIIIFGIVAVINVLFIIPIIPQMAQRLEWVNPELHLTPQMSYPLLVALAPFALSCRHISLPLVSLPFQFDTWELRHLLLFIQPDGFHKIINNRTFPA